MKNTKTKHLWLVLMLLAWGLNLAAQSKLNMHITHHRFRDLAGNTVMHIDYQVPYRNLIFIAHKGGYFAELQVSLNMQAADSLIQVKSLTDNVGITNKDDAFSGKFHLNRISILLDTQPRNLIFRAQDPNSNKSFEWMIMAAALQPNEIMSDVQLCSEVRADSSAFLGKFHRGNTLYQTEPSLILDKGGSANAFLYLEAYPPPQSIGSSQLLALYLEKDSLMVLDEYIDFTPKSAIEGITLRIPLEDMTSGSYTGILTMQIDDEVMEREFEFFVTQTLEPLYSVMNDPDEEILMLRYFSGNQMPMDWNRYDLQTKKRYISGIWKRMATAARVETPSLLTSIGERLEFANRNFKFFKDGWKTDMGKIYIRNGKPDELDKETTLDDTRYVRKDYQIWKYRGKINATYLFIDMQMNGNYQLIYASGDDMESTSPDYLRYLGEGFDTSKLRN